MSIEKELFAEQELSAGLLKRALKAEAKLARIAELPDKWRTVCEGLLDDKIQNAHFIDDCADELQAKLEGVA